MSEGFRHRNIGCNCESIVQSRSNGGDMYRSANDHDSVDIDRDSEAIGFAKITNQEEIGSCN